MVAAAVVVGNDNDEDGEMEGEHHSSGLCLLLLHLLLLLLLMQTHTDRQTHIHTSVYLAMGNLSLLIYNRAGEPNQHCGRETMHKNSYRCCYCRSTPSIHSYFFVAVFPRRQSHQQNSQYLRAEAQECFSTWEVVPFIHFTSSLSRFLLQLPLTPKVKPPCLHPAQPLVPIILSVYFSNMSIILTWEWSTEIYIPTLI